MPGWNSGWQGNRAGAGGGGAADTPSTIFGSGLWGWWKTAIAGLVNNDPVITWPDSSGNGRDLTQATASKRPTYLTNQANGLACVRFDGVDDYLQRATEIVTYTGGYMAVYVSRMLSTAGVGSYLLFNMFSNATNALIDCWHRVETATTTQPVMRLVIAGSFPEVRGPLASGITTWRSSVGIASAAESEHVYHNHEPLFGSVGSMAMPASGLSWPVQLGAYWDGTVNFKGDVAEVLFVNRIPTGMEMGKLFTYLNDRFAL